MQSPFFKGLVKAFSFRPCEAERSKNLFSLEKASCLKWNWRIGDIRSCRSREENTDSLLNGSGERLFRAQCVMKNYSFAATVIRGWRIWNWGNRAAQAETFSYFKKKEWVMWVCCCEMWKRQKESDESGGGGHFTAAAANGFSGLMRISSRGSAEREERAWSCTAPAKHTRAPDQKPFFLFSSANATTTNRWRTFSSRFPIIGKRIGRETRAKRSMACVAGAERVSRPVDCACRRGSYAKGRAPLQRRLHKTTFVRLLYSVDATLNAICPFWTRVLLLSHTDTFESIPRFFCK